MKNKLRLNIARLEVMVIKLEEIIKYEKFDYNTLNGIKDTAIKTIQDLKWIEKSSII